MRAQAIAMAIGQKMDQLEKELNMAITRKVAENFKDPTGPLNALTQAALAPLGRDGVGVLECSVVKPIWLTVNIQC